MDIPTLKEIIKVIERRIKDLKGMALNQTNEKKQLDYLTRIEEQQLTQIALQETLLKEIANINKSK